jgi:hypothetical protein
MGQDRDNCGTGNGLLESVKKLCARIPQRWRWTLRPLRFCYGVYDALRPRFWVVQAKVRDRDPPVAILCSARGGERSYLLGQLFDGTATESYVGRAWLWHAARLLRDRSDGCCLAAVATRAWCRRLLGSGKWLCVPSWVVGEMDLPPAPDVLRAETVKSDLRRIRRNALTFEVTRDPALLNDFYHQMYVPYITRAHGASAVVMSYDAMRAQLPHCELLLVKKQGLAIAGVLILHGRTGTRLWSMGIRDASEQYVDDGAVAAIYHFSAQYLRDQGLHRLGLGLSRAFLHDGVLRYKKKLGLRLVDAAHAYFAFHVPQDTPAARTVLKNTPWIFEDKGCLYGAVFVENGQIPLTEQDFRRLYRDFFLEGMAQVLVVPLDAGAPVATLPQELAGRMAVPAAAQVLGRGSCERRSQ